MLPLWVQGKLRALAFILFAFELNFPSHGQADMPKSPSPTTVLALWKSGKVPFSFKYDGKDSSEFLSIWQKTEETVGGEGGDIHRFTFRDPVTKLKVTAEVCSFRDFPALDWVLNFTNESTHNTPIIEQLHALRWDMPVRADAQLVLHSALGSTGSRYDFQPQETSLPLHGNHSAELQSSGGRSSSGCLPFFNLQDGDRGVLGAIGWTGNWALHFSCNPAAQTIDLTGGMPKTHFLLHAGETVRTPRVVLLSWQGEPGDSQNLWRRFVLAHYSPRDSQGRVPAMPLCFGSWGAELIDAKLKAIKELDSQKIPFDVYWVDAGWYGNYSVPTGKTVDVDCNWRACRGTWTPSPALYPCGLKPLSDALKTGHHAFLLWFESETANKGSALRVEHPGWFMGADKDGVAILNLGNPEARKGITDLISKIIEDSGMNWYRQDFNVEPESSWAAIDTPDRVGMQEMKYVAGLYAFWDDLRTRHPGLQMDNCASGGRRLDLEMMSRGVALWRSDYSDYGAGLFDPSDNQRMTQGLNAWVPLNSAVYAGVARGTASEGSSLIYALRSSYSAGWIFGTDRFDIQWMKPAAEEFLEARPFFIGDMYPATPYGGDLTTWSAIQWARPDLKAGVVVVLRRQNSPYTVLDLGLHAIDLSAQYKVEIRTGFEKTAPQIMLGKELADLQLSLPDKPSSALIFYQQLIE